MKIVDSSGKFMVYSDGLKVYDKLPVGIYKICFNKMTGFYLEQHQDIVIKDNKIYGVHNSKVEKVFNSYSKVNRNFGVMLSGDKGMGKSLFAKLLSLKSIQNKVPVIMVTEYIPAIADFIGSIEQEVMVMFDEFDKTFKFNSQKNENPQDELLTLIDGFDSGKKLFVITCNKVYNLSEYFLNRTGRFHYHFRFEYPNPTEIREYMQDNLDKGKWGEIKNIIDFSLKVKLNYDMLRSIAFEINNGETFKSAIMDLNISAEENYRELKYAVTSYYRNGDVKTYNESLDLFDDEISIEMYDEEKEDTYDVTFNRGDLIPDLIKGVMYVEFAEEENHLIHKMEIKAITTSSLKYRI